MTINIRKASAWRNGLHHKLRNGFDLGFNSLRTRDGSSSYSLKASKRFVHEPWRRALWKENHQEHCLRRPAYLKVEMGDWINYLQSGHSFFLFGLWVLSAREFWPEGSQLSSPIHHWKFICYVNRIDPHAFSFLVLSNHNNIHGFISSQGWTLHTSKRGGSTSWEGQEIPQQNVPYQHSNPELEMGSGQLVGWWSLCIHWE